ncbi:hypothetical protein BJX70DRAFT_104359 [Aspergillus crustosus]
MRLKSYERAPPLPPRPSFASEDRQAQQYLPQAQPPPYDYQSAYQQQQNSSPTPPAAEHPPAHAPETPVQEHIDPQRRQARTPPPPKIQYDPPARFTLRQCPKTVYKLKSGATWYIHPQVPEFTICTYCYDKHIQPSQFQSSFDSWMSTAGSNAQCLFSVPRIEKLLWPRAMQLNSLDEVLQFFKHRLNLSVANCPGEGKTVAAANGVKRFKLSDRYRSRFPGFVACEACYEDVLLASPLKDVFSECTTLQAAYPYWSCDVAVPFVQKLALKADLGVFISATARHLELPACEKEGSMVAAHSRRWYQPRPSNISAEGITICERCYHDFAIHSEFKDNLQPFNPWPNSQQRCTLGFYQARTSWGEAIDNHDFSEFHRAMLEFHKCPPCTLQIPPRTKIYQIPGVENFDVCQTCYAGVIKPYGLDGFFREFQLSASDQKACDLNPSNPRFASYAYKLDEAIITCTFSTFVTYVQRTSTLSPCTKLDLVKGRQWYGVDGCRICPSCYEEVARDTYLAQYIPSTPETLSTSPTGEDGIHCDLYSPRMRAKWQEACAAQSTSEFLQFAAERNSIYIQTVPEMRELVERAKMSAEMQTMHNAMSSFYYNMDGISSVGYGSGYRYTVSGVGGSFATPWGINGVQEGQAAQGHMQSVHGMAARVQYLQTIWDTVE